jgi:RNA polymerase sigma factor (sigma-70 family)
VPRKREIVGSTFANTNHGNFRWTRHREESEHHGMSGFTDLVKDQQVAARTVAHSETRPDTALAALMECAPGQEPLASLEELSPLRDILADAIDALSERDRWIVDSLVTARLSLRQLADQLSLSKTHVARIRDEAMAKLRLALQDNPTIREYLA